jgi:hypothetical protein
MFSHLRIGVAYWQLDELAQLIAVSLEKCGCQVVLFEHTCLPEDVDVVVAYGPLGSLVPLSKQIQQRQKQPAFVLFMTEQLPDPTTPEVIRRLLAYCRTQIEHRAYQQNEAGMWVLDPHWKWLTKRALRYRYYGDLRWLQKKKLLSLLALQSVITAGFLRQQGIDPFVFTLGADPQWGEDLGLDRDIPVLWIGKQGSNRRKALLADLRDTLKAQGVDMMIIDGIAHPYVFGTQRTILLNRSKIVVNLSRQKWDLNSLRFYLAASNRVLMVSEPILPHIPEIVSGKHFIEAPLNQLAQTILFYLEHEKERMAIANAAYDLVKSELTMENGLHRLLQKVIQVANRKVDSP